jgi:hypothetical protein
MHTAERARHTKPLAVSVWDRECACGIFSSVTNAEKKEKTKKKRRRRRRRRFFWLTDRQTDILWSLLARSIVMFSLSLSLPNAGDDAA